MKDKALIYLSLIISIAALGYAAWVDQHAALLAEQALQNRELQFVQKFTPKFRDIYQEWAMTNVVANPTTLDELFSPFLDVMNRMAQNPAADETNSDMVSLLTNSTVEIKTNQP
jgi:hypothetical protein